MIATVFDTLVWALAFSLCVPGLGGRPARAVAVLLGIALAISIPLADSSLMGALRGLFAGLSVASLVVLTALFVARVQRGGVFAGGERVSIAVLATVVGVLFYPLALGLGPVDPYAWGYGGATLALIAGGVGLLAWMAGLRVLVLCLVLALPAWRMQLLASPNLWDYLIDPLLAIGALIALIVMALKSARRVSSRPEQPGVKRGAA
ncbi:MAG: hypothetical protein Q7J47_07610 [Azoarcus sp.]|nr:hypothetical protein [Azoarcus sp.]